MVQPINYLAGIPQPDLAGALSGLGGELQRLRGERQQEAKLAQYQQDLSRTFQSGRAEDFAALIAKYPEQREAFKDSWEILESGQKESQFREGVQAYQALKNNPGVAVQMLDERIQAEENSGRDPRQLQMVREMATTDPERAANYLAFTLSSVDPERWSSMASERRAAERAPAELTKAQSEAHKAAVQANFAESKAVADLQNTGWETRKLAEDVETARHNRKIAALEADLKREESDLKRQELRMKQQEAIQERDEAIREKTAEVASVKQTMDNSLNTIDRLLDNPELDNILGAVEGARFYPSTLVGLVSPFSDADKRADAMADIETIQSQTFLNQLIDAKSRGATFGALTEREGAKLESSVQSLRTQQSEEQFRRNLSEIQRLLLKSRSQLTDKYGVPETLPDRPEVQTTPEPQPEGELATPTTGRFRVLGVE